MDDMSQSKLGSPGFLSGPNRVARACVLHTVHDLRRSITLRRAMSLPTCLRLCQRRLNGAGVPSETVAHWTSRLKTTYLRHQPFSRGTTHLELRLTDDA